MEKNNRGIGDNSKTESNYKTLFENLIAMVLEPKIHLDTYLKDSIERARISTKIADRFEALQEAEADRKILEDRLNTLEYFQRCKKHNFKPLDYKWEHLKSQWGNKIHDEFKLQLKDAWKDENYEEKR
jgi:hypothetical protein|tara:strand:+ start:299 stop:682 length:384 start_codon:yes stop_codon:yes gene_type:complete